MQDLSYQAFSMIWNDWTMRTVLLALMFSLGQGVMNHSAAQQAPGWAYAPPALQVGMANEGDIFSWQPERGLDTPHVRGSLEGVAATVPALIAWVVDTRDHQGLPFIIADKKKAQIMLIHPSGQIIQSAPALFGKHIGDEAVLGQTPAGAYTIQRHFTDEAGYGGDVVFFWSEEGADYAIHRTYTLTPQERRTQRLLSPTIADNRVSNGCINISPDDYDGWLVSLHGARLYVLPERSTTFLAEHRGVNWGIFASTSSTFRSSEPVNEFESNPPSDSKAPRKAPSTDKSRYW